MSKTVNPKQFNRLAGQLEQLEIEQLGDLFAETIRRKTAAMVSAEIAVEEQFVLKEAAYRAGVSPETMRRWCHQYGIGQQFGPVWVVGGLALEAFLKSRAGVVELSTSDMPAAPHHKQKKSA